MDVHERLARQREQLAALRGLRGGSAAAATTRSASKTASVTGAAQEPTTMAQDTVGGSRRASEAGSLFAALDGLPPSRPSVSVGALAVGRSSRSSSAAAANANHAGPEPAATRADVTRLQHRAELRFILTSEADVRHRIVCAEEAEERLEIVRLFTNDAVAVGHALYRRVVRLESKVTHHGAAASQLRHALTADLLDALNAPHIVGGSSADGGAPQASSSRSDRLSPISVVTDVSHETRSATATMVAEVDAVERLKAAFLRERDNASAAWKQVGECEAKIHDLQRAARDREKQAEEHRDPSAWLRVEELEEATRARYNSLRRDHLAIVAELEQEIAGLLKAVARADGEAKRCQDELSAVFDSRQASEALLVKKLEESHADKLAAAESALRQQLADANDRIEAAERRARGLATKLLRVESQAFETAASRSAVVRQLEAAHRARDALAAEASSRVAAAEARRGRDELHMRRVSADLKAQLAEKHHQIEVLNAALLAHEAGLSPSPFRPPSSDPVAADATANHQATRASPEATGKRTRGAQLTQSAFDAHATRSQQYRRPAPSSSTNKYVPPSPPPTPLLLTDDSSPRPVKHRNDEAAAAAAGHRFPPPPPMKNGSPFAKLLSPRSVHSRVERAARFPDTATTAASLDSAYRMEEKVRAVIASFAGRTAAAGELHLAEDDEAIRFRGVVSESAQANHHQPPLTHMVRSQSAQRQLLDAVHGHDESVTSPVV